MSFGFGKNSGPTAPPSSQTPFGHPPSPTLSPPFFPSNSSVNPRFPSPRSHDTHVRPRSPVSSTSNFDQHAPPNMTLDAHVRPRVPSLGNDRSTLDNSQQHPAMRPSFSHRPNKKNTVSGAPGSQSQKRPFPSSQDRGAGMSSKLPHLQNSESSRSPPIHYDDDFLLDSTGDVTQGTPFLHDKRNPQSPDFSGQTQKRPFPYSRDLETSPSSKHSHLQNMKGSRSPPIQYDDDFLLDPSGEVKQGNVAFSSSGQSQKRPFLYSRDLGTSPSSKHSHLQSMEGSRSPIQYDDDFLMDPSGDVKQGNADSQSNLYGHGSIQRRQSPSTIASNHSIINPQPSWNISQRPKPRPSLSPPKLRSGTTGVGRPNNQELSPFTDEINGDTTISRPSNQSFPKRSRSPVSFVGQLSQTTPYSPEDDADREQQAKAKRLARFKTELVDSEPIDSIRYSQNVTKGRISTMKSDRTLVEKPKFSGNVPSGSMEDQDFENEESRSNSVIVGLCTDMCPESEREERERKGDLDQYERVDGDRNQSSRTLAVKKYNRTAEREAELIRPMPILLKTMDYLLGLLELPYDDSFLGLYNFLWDRMRAIRMDLRMQHIFNERAITMLEQMIRLHIIAMHELCEFSKGEGFSEGFDAHLNIEQMNKTSVELLQLYDDHRKRGIFIPTEKEFRGYYALLKLDRHPGYKVEPAELSLDLAQMTPEIRQTLEVLFARDVARSCRTSNFIAFFRHARSASYLQACLMHAHFSKLRTQALASLHSGLQYNQGLPVAQAAKWLGMEGEDIESLLEYHGFSVKEFEEPYMVKEGPFLNVEKDYPTRRSILVHKKKSNTILEDVLSSNQVIFPQSKPSKSNQNRKANLGTVQSIQTKSPILPHDTLMDIEPVSSPKWSMPVPPILETPRNSQVLADLRTSRDSQTFTDNYHRVSPGSPRDIRVSLDSPRNIRVSSDSPRDTRVSSDSPRDTRVSSDSPRDIRVSRDSPRDNRVSVGSPRNYVNPFASFSSQTLPPSPLTPKHSPLNANAMSSPENIIVQQFFPSPKFPNFGFGKQSNIEGRVAIPSDFVARSEMKLVGLEGESDGKVRAPDFEVGTSIVNSLQDDKSLKETSNEDFVDLAKQCDNDVDDNYDKEVAEAKLRLLLRLWRRRFLRRKYICEQNRFAANAALNSLNLGPPIQQNWDKTTPCKKLNIYQAMNERNKKQQTSLTRWNVSDLVASKLAEKNNDLNCICWKVILFSWSKHGKRDDMDTTNSLSQMYLDEWLRYKLIPSRKDEAEGNMVISSPGLAIWRKWGFDHSGNIRCFFSVVKDSQPGNSEKNLTGVNAIIFPISDSLSWDIKKTELNNLVASLPYGVSIPLLIVSDSGEENFSEFSLSISDKLGLNDICKSRVSRFMIICLDEEGNSQFQGYFSDEKLKEGLVWLASESNSQPHLFCVTVRELVSYHLNVFLDPGQNLGQTPDPSQCISAFNQALDRSINDIITASNSNPSSWPCPELFLMDNSTPESRLVKRFLPTSGWSSSEEVGPLIASLENSKLPSFSEDISFLNIACVSEKNIEDQKQQLQESLIRYLSRSGNLLTSMMAIKESHLMVQKYTHLELHGSVFKLIPNWLNIFKRVFNWQLNSSGIFSCKAYVLEQSLNTHTSPILDKLELDSRIPEPYYISQPCLDEMVEVSCSPIVSKRVRSSPKSLQKGVEVVSDEGNIGISLPDFVEEERNQCSGIQVVDNSDIEMRENDRGLVPKDDKKGDRLSQLLDQCSILQDEIEKKLSIYF